MILGTLAAKIFFSEDFTIVGKSALKDDATWAVLVDDIAVVFMFLFDKGDSARGNNIFFSLFFSSTNSLSTFLADVLDSLHWETIAGEVMQSFLEIIALLRVSKFEACSSTYKNEQKSSQMSDRNFWIISIFKILPLQKFDVQFFC